AGALGWPAGLQRVVSAIHVYADNGVYTVRLFVSDDDGAEAVGQTTLTVTTNNVAPVVEAGETFTIDEGQSFPYGASFSDAGTADTRTASVNWGDGASSAGTVTETP